VPAGEEGHFKEGGRTSKNGFTTARHRRKGRVKRVWECEAG